VNIFWLIAAVLFAVAACCFGGWITINAYTFVAGGVSSICLAVWAWPAFVTARRTVVQQRTVVPPA
jgi:F0F1-type ATP synthase assembly protein I